MYSSAFSAVGDIKSWCSHKSFRVSVSAINTQIDSEEIVSVYVGSEF